MQTMNALLPHMSQTKFATLVKSSEPSEGRINGVWGSIFYDHFYASCNDGTTSLSPEVHSIGYSDYVVTRNTYNDNGGPPYVRTIRAIYEGKAAGKDSPAKVADQLLGYAEALLKDGQECVLIGAIGREVNFWKYQKQDGVPSTVHPLYINNNAVDCWIVPASDQSKGNRPTKPPLSIVDNARDVKLLLGDIA